MLLRSVLLAAVPCTTLTVVSETREGPFLAGKRAREDSGDDSQYSSEEAATTASSGSAVAAADLDVTPAMAAMELKPVAMEVEVPQAAAFPAAYSFSGNAGYPVTDAMRAVKQQLKAKGYVYISPQDLSQQIIKQLGAPPKTLYRYLHQVGDDTPIHNIPVMKFRRMGGVRFSYRKDFRSERREVAVWAVYLEFVYELF